MNNLYKTISLGLVLAILILNFPVGKPKSCNSPNVMEKMTCCSTSLTSGDWIGENLASRGCHCEITDRSEAPVPLIAATQSVNQYFKGTAKNFEKNYSCLDFSLEPPFISTKFEIFFQPKFAANLKIYDFLSSYLI